MFWLTENGLIPALLAFFVFDSTQNTHQLMARLVWLVELMVSSAIRGRTTGVAVPALFLWPRWNFCNCTKLYIHQRDGEMYTHHAFLCALVFIMAARRGTCLNPSLRPCECITARDNKQIYTIFFFWSFLLLLLFIPRSRWGIYSNLLGNKCPLFRPI